jgi:hypothetical protein
MRCFNFYYKVDDHVQSGEFWASGRDRVMQMIMRVHPTAKFIHVW